MFRILTEWWQKSSWDNSFPVCASIMNFSSSPISNGTAPFVIGVATALSSSLFSPKSHSSRANDPTKHEINTRHTRHRVDRVIFAVVFQLISNFPPQFCHFRSSPDVVESLWCTKIRKVLPGNFLTEWRWNKPGAYRHRNLIMLMRGNKREKWKFRFFSCDMVHNCTMGENALQWRHNERDCFSIHQSQDCLLNRLFRRRSKKTSIDQSSASPGHWPLCWELTGDRWIPSTKGQ